MTGIAGASGDAMEIVDLDDAAYRAALADSVRDLTEAKPTRLTHYRPDGFDVHNEPLRAVARAYRRDK